MAAGEEFVRRRATHCHFLREIVTGRSMLRPYGFASRGRADDFDFGEREASKAADENVA